MQDEVRIQAVGRGYVVTAPGFYTWQETRAEAREWLHLLRRERTRRLQRAIAGIPARDEREDADAPRREVAAPAARADPVGAVRRAGRTTSSCERLSVPENAHLDLSGNAWECDRGYTQRGDRCVPAG